MTTAKRKSRTTKKRTGKKNLNKTIKDEILVLAFLAVSILMLLSNFGLVGAVGKYIRYFQFGIFGLAAYIIPIAIFLSAVFSISNKGNKTAYLKLASAVFFLVSVCILMQFITSDVKTVKTVTEYYRYGALEKKGGGVIGGVLARLLYKAFGTAGTLVISLAVLIISAVIITERSFLSGVKKSGHKVYESAREDYRKRRIKQSEEKENKKENDRIQKKRLQRKISGVALDTTIPKENKEMEDVHEITGPYPEDFLKSDKNTDSIDETDSFLTKEVITEADMVNNGIEKEKDTVNIRSREADIKNEDYADIFAAANQEAFETGDKKEYQYPPIELLKPGKKGNFKNNNKQVNDTAHKLQQTLHNFGVNVTITHVSCGPTVTRYELQPEQGVKVSKILSLSDDIKLNLAASDIRIEAPIPGKAAIGIEVPNKNNAPVMLRDLLEAEEFRNHPSRLAFAAGKDIGGQTVVTDVAKMPHLLIAGATGSGKSVCINTLIMSILYKSTPDEVKLIMIDPKVVELSVYNGIPHLMIPVVTDPKKAAGALNWAVVEMQDRYQKFAQYNVRDMKSFNEKVESVKNVEGENRPEKLPQIVIIVDELADLMMVAPGEVEESICRLAQLARAAGIHLILATQRPSVNVITGLIKANMPSRIAFSVSSGVDSRTILDMNGAEKLLGKGDMLFYPQGYPKPVRVQGSFVSDSEVSAVVKFLVNENKDVFYSAEMEEKIINNTAAAANQNTTERDPYFTDCGKFIIEKDKASIGLLQRAFKIGFNRAARIMDQLAEAGVVGEEEGTKPRKILMTMEEFEAFAEESV